MLYIRCQSPVGSGGLVQRNSMMEFHGLRRTPPRLNMPILPVSHQHIPGFESGGVSWNPLESGGLYWTPPDSSEIHQTPAEFTRLQQIPPDSNGLQQIICSILI